MTAAPPAAPRGPAASATGTAGAVPAGALSVPCRPTRRRQETAGTVTFRLEPVGEALPPCAPGPFAPGPCARVYAFGAGEIPVPVSGIPDSGLIHAGGEARRVVQERLRRLAGSVLCAGDPSDAGLNRPCEEAIRHRDPCLPLRSTHFLFPDLTADRGSTQRPWRTVP